jgi:hypothetical protein
MHFHTLVALRCTPMNGALPMQIHIHVSRRRIHLALITISRPKLGLSQVSSKPPTMLVIMPASPTTTMEPSSSIPLVRPLIPRASVRLSLCLPTKPYTVIAVRTIVGTMTIFPTSLHPLSHNLGVGSVMQWCLVWWRD